MKFIKITKSERKKYDLTKKIDTKILKKIKLLDLASKKLSQHDRKMLSFIKTQLEPDWRKPLIKELNKIRAAKSKN